MSVPMRTARKPACAGLNPMGRYWLRDSVYSVSFSGKCAAARHGPLLRPYYFEQLHYNMAPQGGRMRLIALLLALAAALPSATAMYSTSGPVKVLDASKFDKKVKSGGVWLVEVRAHMPRVF